jgi:inhibitor of KinA sporulation pathway (predicted exonuclease)
LAIYKDTALVVDIEATCWDGYDAPDGQENEVIEIGVCTLDLATLDIGEAESILVKPTHSEISPFCTQLTTITPDMVAEHGVSFAEACSQLETRFNSRNRLWCSWGSWDFKMMRDQCKRREVRYPFSDKHANLKRIYADAQKNRIGLKAALEALAIPLEGTHHRGNDDARNAARALVALLQTHTASILRKYGI